MVGVRQERMDFYCFNGLDRGGTQAVGQNAQFTQGWAAVERVEAIKLARSCAAKRQEARKRASLQINGSAAGGPAYLWRKIMRALLRS